MMKESICGSLESSDCLIKIAPYDELKIEITSPVKEKFGYLIEKVVSETLSEMNVDKCLVNINDRGALDYVIKARLETAIRRAYD